MFGGLESISGGLGRVGWRISFLPRLVFEDRRLKLLTATAGGFSRWRMAASCDAGAARVAASDDETRDHVLRTAVRLGSHCEA